MVFHPDTDQRKATLPPSILPFHVPLNLVLGPDTGQQEKLPMLTLDKNGFQIRCATTHDLFTGLSLHAFAAA